MPTRNYKGTDSLCAMLCLTRWLCVAAAGFVVQAGAQAALHQQQPPQAATAISFFQQSLTPATTGSVLVISSSTAHTPPFKQQTLTHPTTTHGDRRGTYPGAKGRR